MPLRSYRCHKVVQAAKIQSIEIHPTEYKSYPTEYATLWFGPSSGADFFNVTPDWLKRHDPKSGGYFVRYEDGVESFSPAKDFEDRYTLIEDES